MPVSIKWNFLPLENLSQVEIIKGASSVLYGSSALNGVINFRTADASNIPLTHILCRRRYIRQLRERRVEMVGYAKVLRQCLILSPSEIREYRYRCRREPDR
ncbi:MAG: TonB-dependent receptor plug domain-containing protein [Marinilabiliales bacterium]|nr:TonB-dependent receptor plug domain-containing protein [Marinilabiliales bacterium]